MAWLRLVNFESTVVWRSYSRLALPVMVVALWAIFLQEPAIFRRAGLDFAWASSDRLVLLLELAVPLAWALRRSPTCRDLESRYSRQPIRSLIARAAGVSLASVIIGAAGVGASFTLDSILSGPPSSSGPSVSFFRVLLCAMPLGPLAFVLAPLPGARCQPLLWLVCLACSVGVLGRGLPLPLDVVLNLSVFSDAIDASLILPFCLATVGCYLAAIAVSVRPLRR